MTPAVQLKDTGDSFRENLIMNDKQEKWVETFQTLFDEKVTAYKNDIQTVAALFSNEEEAFLRTIGATPQEIFDFVEDWCDDGEPTPEMALAITRIRRDYFLNEQQGRISKFVRSADLFPPRDASLAGLEWFPRIIEKAKAKLQGELPSDLMYSCGGDRRFLKKVRVNPDEFLQVVREAGDDVDHIITFVTNRSNA